MHDMWLKWFQAFEMENVDAFINYRSIFVSFLEYFEFREYQWQIVGMCLIIWMQHCRLNFFHEVLINTEPTDWRAYIHIHIYKYMYTRAHTNTHTQIYIYMPIYCYLFFFFLKGWDHEPEIGVLRGTPKTTVGPDNTFWGTLRYSRFWFMKEKKFIT